MATNYSSACQSAVGRSQTVVLSISATIERPVLMKADAQTRTLEIGLLNSRLTPSMSLYVECESFEVLENAYNNISDGGVERMTLDNYGLVKNFLGWMNATESPGNSILRSPCSLLIIV